MSAKSRSSKKHSRQLSHAEQLAALHKMGAFERGKVYDVAVLHDDWCPKLSGGTCACQPDLRICPVKDGAVL